MDSINVRYDEDVTLQFDADDATAVSATLYVGNPGEVPLITAPITLTDGVGVFELSRTDTSIPLGTYKYQINVENELGQVEKYPDPTYCDDCDDDSFPEFTVFEALDATEVVS